MGNVKGVRHRVEHVLSKDQVKQLKQQGMFPKELNKDTTPGYSQRQDGNGLQAIYMHNELDNDFINPNHRVPVKYCSEEEEDTSDEDGEDEVSLVEANEE